MFRSLPPTARMLGTAMMLAWAAVPAVSAPLAAQTDTRPVVAVLSFDNNSIGAGRQDYDGLGKGIQEMLISDLASSAKIRVVDRERIQRVLDEQNLVKGGAVDAETAVRVGRILGAQYAIYGGFMSDGHGTMVLTAHSTDMETSAIGNPMRVQRKTDDVLGLIADMSTKLNAEIKLDGHAERRMGDAGGTGGTSALAGAPAQSGAPAVHHAEVETFAKPMSTAPIRTRLDAATLKLYSNALDAMDRHEQRRAAELFRQVVAKFPAFAPAQDKLRAMGDGD
jgi:TolB-like protein